MTIKFSLAHLYVMPNTVKSLAVLAIQDNNSAGESKCMSSGKPKRGHTNDPT